jgi:hypothetical protein
MNKGLFACFCGEYLVFAKIEAPYDMPEGKENYHIELERDRLLLSFGGVTMSLTDDQTTVFRLKDDIPLSQANDLSDYDEICLPISAFSGVKTLLSMPYVILSADISK